MEGKDGGERAGRGRGGGGEGKEEVIAQAGCAIYLTHIFGAVRVWLTPGTSISLRQLVRTDVFQKNLSPVTCSLFITRTSSTILGYRAPCELSS